MPNARWISSTEIALSQHPVGEPEQALGTHDNAPSALVAFRTIERYNSPGVTVQSAGRTDGLAKAALVTGKYAVHSRLSSHDEQARLVWIQRNVLGQRTPHDAPLVACATGYVRYLGIQSRHPLAGGVRQLPTSCCAGDHSTCSPKFLPVRKDHLAEAVGPGCLALSRKSWKLEVAVPQGPLV